MFTDGKGPCARRRQCCCVVGSKVYLFGGTSPNPHPHTRLPLAHRIERASDLIDHADLHVLDFGQCLAALAVCRAVLTLLRTETVCVCLYRHGGLVAKASAS